MALLFRSNRLVLSPPLRASRTFLTVVRSGLSQNTYQTHVSGLSSPSAHLACQQRYFTPMTEEEKEAEKQRVAGLTEFQKDQELRALNRQIAKLEMLKGINTGELYTWTGRYKQLSRDYGFPLMAYYFSVWGLTGIGVYMLLQFGNVDAMALIARVDSMTGFDFASKIDPTYGTIGLTLVVNEMIEPLRLPIVILTVKPVVDRIFPPKF